MIFYYLDKIVSYRLKQEDKKIKLTKAISDLKKSIKNKITNKPTQITQEKTKYKSNFTENIPPIYNTKNYTTIVLSKKKLDYIKKYYSSFFIEYALAKELSENGYSTLIQSAVTKGLKEKNIF